MAGTEVGRVVLGKCSLWICFKLSQRAFLQMKCEVSRSGARASRRMELPSPVMERQWAVGAAQELRWHVELEMALPDLHLEMLRSWTLKS